MEKKNEKSTSKKKDNNIRKSPMLKLLSYLMIMIAVLQLIFIVFQSAYFYKIHKTGQELSWLIVINETIVLGVIAVLELKMGIYGKRGALGDKYSLKKCRSYAASTVGVTMLYICLVLISREKKEVMSIISQITYPIVYFFATFLPYIEDQMAKEAASIEKEKQKLEKEENNKAKKK